MSEARYSLVFEAITAVATLAVPVVVAVMAHRFNNQLKRWEASQWRNQELIKARLQYYQDLVPQLNDVMCYFTFVGPWKDFTPPEVVQMKRRLDRAFYCAAPLFGELVQDSYSEFIDDCFETYGAWGTDARLRTGFGRRKQAAGQAWDPSWENLFTYLETQPIPPDILSSIRSAYNAVITAFAKDIELYAPRDRYVDISGQFGAH